MSDGLLPNKRRARLAVETRAADSVSAADAVVILGVDPSERLDAFDLTVKWVVMKDQAIRLLPKIIHGVEISHAYLASGEDVLAAGEADFAPEGDGSYFGAKITNESGHYEPPLSTLELAVKLFRQHRIHFKPDAIVPFQED